MPDLGETPQRLSGDLALLLKKEFDGKLITAEGTRTTSGDIATITAASGKDMYLAKAKCSVRLTGVDTLANVFVELKANAVIKATWSVRPHMGANAQGFAGTNSFNYEFVMSGLKVLATEIIKLEAVTVDANVEVNGELVCLEEDTGADPIL